MGNGKQKRNQGAKKFFRGQKSSSELVLKDTSNSEYYATITKSEGSHFSAILDTGEHAKVTLPGKMKKSWITSGSVVLVCGQSHMREIQHIYTPDQVNFLQKNSEYKPRLDDSDNVFVNDEVVFADEDDEDERYESIYASSNLQKNTVPEPVKETIPTDNDIDFDDI